MGCFVVAEFLLTSASRGPSAIAEPLVPQCTRHTDRETDRQTHGHTDKQLDQQMVGPLDGIFETAFDRARHSLIIASKHLKLNEINKHCSIANLLLRLGLSL